MILPLLAIIGVGQPFACTVVSVHDADGPFHCSSGVSIRLAGVQAPDYEDSPPCRQHRAEFVCDDQAATESRDRMRQLIEGQTLDCISTGKSYKRTVARCRLNGVDLSCVAISGGMATRWAKFDPEHRLDRCGRR